RLVPAGEVGGGAVGVTIPGGRAGEEFAYLGAERVQVRREGGGRGPARAGAASARGRQAEPALGDEVALDLAGAAVDRGDGREPVAVLVERAQRTHVVRLHEACRPR